MIGYFNARYPFLGPPLYNVSLLTNERTPKENPGKCQGQIIM